MHVECTNVSTSPRGSLWRRVVCSCRLLLLLLRSCKARSAASSRDTKAKLCLKTHKRSGPPQIIAIIRPPGATARAHAMRMLAAARKAAAESTASNHDTKTKLCQNTQTFRPPQGHTPWCDGTGSCHRSGSLSASTPAAFSDAARLPVCVESAEVKGAPGEQAQREQTEQHEAVCVESAGVEGAPAERGYPCPSSERK